MRTKAKTFDCVEMKRRGADLVQKRIAGLSPEQELEYWRERTAELRRRQAQIRNDLAGQRNHSGPAPAP